MNLKNILWVRNTGHIVPNAPIADNLFGLKLSDSGIITTATGNPVLIITNKAQNAISTILSYSPRQSGSGDPSPQNIRPIEGWTEANLGVNSETPTTITESLGGTYYGFSIDLERGVLRATHKISVIDENRGFRFFEDNKVWRTNPLQEDFEIAGAEGVICNQYRKSQNRGGTAGIVLANADLTFCTLTSSSSNKTFYAHDERFVNEDDPVTALKAWLSENPIYYVQPLATPLELPITPQTVALLKGNNTIWTDGDELSVTYKAKKA